MNNRSPVLNDSATVKEQPVSVARQRPTFPIEGLQSLQDLIKDGAAEAEAGAELEDSVTTFIDQIPIFCVIHSRNPFASDLAPLFAEYAVTVLDSIADELLPTVVCLDSHLKFRHCLNCVLKSLSESLGGLDGLWKRTLTAASAQADFYSQETASGCCSIVVLRVCRCNRVRAILKRRLKHWNAEAWLRLADQKESRASEFISDRQALSTAQQVMSSQAWVELGERLKEAKGGMKMRDFAKSLGCSESLIYALRRGEARCSLATLKRILGHIQCSLEHLSRTIASPAGAPPPSCEKIHKKSSLHEGAQVLLSSTEKSNDSKKIGPKESALVEDHTSWLATKADWCWFGTITLRTFPNREWASKAITNFFENLEKHAGKPIAWYAAEALGSEGRPHVHFVVANVEHLNRKAYVDRAFKLFGFTSITPYDWSRGGLRYIARHLVQRTSNLIAGGKGLKSSSVARGVK